jgi:hypothetical protein
VLKKYKYFSEKELTMKKFFNELEKLKKLEFVERGGVI